MIINLNHAKKVAAGCLAMTSCAFFLWTQQNNIQADTTTSTATMVPMEQSQSTGVSAGQTEGQSSQAINTQDLGNYAWLDQAQINNAGELNVSGWHATNESQARPYHYLIAFDTTNNQEISRQNITDQEVSRPDVANIHNVYGAATSGFNASFNLDGQLATLNQLQIISRYTDDINGNGNYVDYWFAPITVNRDNNAYLDSVAVDDNQLVVNGWHTTNLAADKANHFIIVLDQTDHREVARVTVDRPVSRPDVARVYPDIEGAASSGFSVKIPLTNLNLNHELQVISRYSGSTDGNSDYVDYWFNPITSSSAVNYGYLDSVNLTDGQHLTAIGWHATDLSPLENNHFLILYDQTANEQVGAIAANEVERPDVARSYPNVNNVAQSGFTASFDLTKAKLTPEHTYALVSRYSTSDQGNGGDGQYTDYWYAPFTLNQSAHYIDNLQMTKNGLEVSGWMISDQTINKPYAFVIVLNNGKEVNRSAVQLTSRPDVGNAYSGIYNSSNSGFTTTVNLDPATVNGTMQVILRFTDDEAGNGNYTDQYSQEYSTNAGNFDQITVNDGWLYVSGWHASNEAVNKPYEYLIFLNQDGQELDREPVPDNQRQRTDVAQVFPGIYNNDKSGYQLGFRIPANLQHQLVYVIHRFTDDVNGNGNYVDYRSDLVPLDIMRTPIDYNQPSEYAPYPNVRQLNNFWIHVRIGQNRVYLMNGNDVVYTMYCTAGYYQNGVSTTPTGTYYIQAERGNSFYNANLGEGANYWTSFLNHGEYLFHSVPTDANGNYKPYDASQLGVNQGSHGCIRLSVPDAYWFMNNVPTGTRVVIDN